MGLRSTFIFEIFPYPGRDEPEMITLHLYKHDDSDPASMQRDIGHHWRAARQQLAGDMNSYNHHPQISLCQAIAGLMMADAAGEFRLTNAVSGDSEYIYRFRQPSINGDETQLTITDTASSKVVFEGTYRQFANFSFL